MEQPETLPSKAVACNFIEGSSACSKGARAYILDANQGNANEHVRIFARSRSGRWIDLWIKPEAMRDYRVVTVVPEERIVFARLSGVSGDAWIAGLHIIPTTNEWCTYMNGRVNQHAKA